MKFVKIDAGWYQTEDYKYEIHNHYGFWEVLKSVEGKHKRVPVYFPHTLKDGKEWCEKDAVRN